MAFISKIKDIIPAIVIVTKFNIQRLISDNITGIEKKEELDKCVIEYIDKYPINMFIKSIFKALVPVITQQIFNCIQTKMLGVTDK